MTHFDYTLDENGFYNVGSRVMNTYLYPITNGYVMVDTGYEHGYRKVCRRMQKAGIDICDIKYIFLTHAHDDHAGFLKEMLTEYPQMKCIVNEKSKPRLAEGQNSFVGGCSSRLALFFCKLMALLGNGEHLFPAVGMLFSDRLIEVTEKNADEVGAMIEGKILFTPGHTMDSISVKVGNRLFCGDAAMNGLPSLNRITIWIENTIDYGRTWDMLISENPDVIYPAHGKSFNVKDLVTYREKIARVKLHKLK